MVVLTLNLIKHSWPTPAIQCNAGFAPLCFYQVQSQDNHLPEILEHFVLPYVYKLYGDADFLFQKHLAPAHRAKTTSNWCTDHGITVLLGLTDPPTGLTWTPQRICVLLSRGGWETQDPTTQMSLRPLSKQTWASITPQQYYLQPPCHAPLMKTFVQKYSRPSIECINWHTFQKVDIWVL